MEPDQKPAAPDGSPADAPSCFANSKRPTFCHPIPPQAIGLAHREASLESGGGHHHLIDS